MMYLLQTGQDVIIISIVRDRHCTCLYNKINRLLCMGTATAFTVIIGSYWKPTILRINLFVCVLCLS